MTGHLRVLEGPRSAAGTADPGSETAGYKYARGPDEVPERMQRTSDVSEAPGFSPLAHLADWLPFKDAVYSLITGRGPRKSPHTLGDEMDRVLVRRLSKLRPDGPMRTFMLAALFDVGSDVGRYVFGRFLPEGSLGPALDVMSRATSQSGLCGLKWEETFFRQAAVTLQPSQAAGECDPDVLTAYVAGLLHGSLAEAFNCHVRITPSGRQTFELALGEGRDVNKELSRRG